MRKVQQGLYYLTLFGMLFLMTTTSIQAQELEINGGENILASSINWNNFDKVTIKSGGTLTIDVDVTKSGSMQEFKVEGVLVINTGFTLTWPGGMTFTEGDSNDSTINGNIIQSNGVFKIDKKNVVGSGGVLIEGPSDNFTLDGGGTLFGQSSKSSACPSYPCQAGVALPVELVTFEVGEYDGVVMLHWVTASEIDNHYFDIERSSSGTDFKPIGRLEGHGTKEQATRYEFADEMPVLNQTSYYRLRQVDFDGTEDFSPIVSVQMRAMATKADWTLFPNPTKSTIGIRFSGILDERVQIRVVDAQGKLIRTYEEHSQSSYLSYPIADIPAGTYWVQIIKAGEISQEKIIIH
ncbi:MAG: T9SS type A sorting domain-containing protein [Bacteroidota bacterium]